jgi:ubiquinone/menaquinone biosynthesis C-methylase UbiE
MEKPMSNLHFRMMSLGFRFRDIFLQVQGILKESGIRPGLCILDFGCGPGSYSIAAAEMTGDSGKVYALDIHPLAVQSVQKRAAKKGLKNIETILSDCATGLPDESVDVALLYDTFHELGDQEEVLKELHRVLKPGGILSISDHHMKESEITDKIGSRGMFDLSGKGEYKGIQIYGFVKK